jgi:hypothetical protein
MSEICNLTAADLRAANRRVLVAGDDYQMGFTVVEPDGSYVDLTGAKVWFTVKETPQQEDSEAELQLSSTNPTEISIDDPENGHFVVFFTTANTQNLAGEWKYDIQGVISPGVVVTFCIGYIEFLPNITRTIA